MNKKSNPHLSFSLRSGRQVSTAFGLLLALAGAHAFADDNVLRLGAGAHVEPRYSGSDQNIAGVALMFDYQMQNGFFASSMRGLGYGGSVGGFSYSAALAYRGGRSDSDKGRFSGDSGSNFLRGMGSIKGSATVMLGVGYAPAKWLSLNAVAELPLSHRENGKAFHFGATGILCESESDKLSLGAMASVGDRKYTQTYYGVTEQQSASFAFAVYKPKAGLYAVNTDLTWEHKFDKTWSIISMVGANHLTGDAAKSPIVKRKTAPTAGVFVSYTY